MLYVSKSGLHGNDGKSKVKSVQGSVKNAIATSPSYTLTGVCSLAQPPFPFQIPV